MFNDLDFEVNGRNRKTLHFVQQQYPRRNNRGAMTWAHKTVWPDFNCFVKLSLVYHRSRARNKFILKKCVVMLSVFLNIGGGGVVGCGDGVNKTKWITRLVLASKFTFWSLSLERFTDFLWEMLNLLELWNIIVTFSWVYMCIAEAIVSG